MCLKTHLNISSSARDTFLTSILSLAKTKIAEEGITLDMTDIGDCGLVWLYGGFLYNKRLEADMTMPPYLRYALNNRLFSEKAGAVDG